MTGNLMGGDGLIVLIVALVVLVGGSQLPKIARNVGLAGKEFRKAQSEAEEEQAKAARAGAPESQHGGAGSPVSPPVALPSTPPTAVGPSGSEASTINLTPAQLDALLKAREEQVRNETTGN